MRHFSFLGALLVLLVGCGTAKNIPIEQMPTSKEFEFNSIPQGAMVYYNGRYLGKTPFSTEVTLNYVLAAMPTSGTVKDPIINKWLRANEDASRMDFVFVKEGYQNDTVSIKPSVQNSGRKLRYPFGEATFLYSYPDGVFSNMKERRPETRPADNPTYYKDDPTIVAGEANNRVTRDNPGGTALERTIIRWYIDSEPRGARVFWRVISSVPDEVKNTNELYLGTTPYEDTRSFNILGLTYQNSRDVQIEIKLTRPGYMDQTKRFNVRQAIDQQEISSFYDLVKQ